MIEYTIQEPPTPAAREGKLNLQSLGQHTHLRGRCNYSPAPLHMRWPAVPLSAFEGGQPHWYEYVFLLSAALIGL